MLIYLTSFSQLDNRHIKYVVPNFPKTRQSIFHLLKFLKIDKLSKGACLGYWIDLGLLIIPNKIEFQILIKNTFLFCCHEEIKYNEYGFAR